MTESNHDRGLRAVRRVRSARESDSRIGLQHALAESRRKDEEASRLAARLDSAAPFSRGTATEFCTRAMQLTELAQAGVRARDAAAASERVAAEASRRWQRDRTEVRVVDLLLDRRAAERSAERARRESADLDDLAATAWLRRRTAEEGQ